MGFLTTEGTSGNYPSISDSAALSITGDIDLRVDMAPAVWSAQQMWIAKHGTAGQRSWFFYRSGAAAFRWRWSEDGSTDQALQANDFIKDDGTRWQMRLTHDVDNGAADSLITYYDRDPALGLSLDDDTNWTTVGTDLTGATTSFFDGTFAVYVGTTVAQGDKFIGDIYQAVIKDGINGTTVLDADFTDLTPAEVAAAAFTEDSAQAATVTLNGTLWSYVSDSSPLMLLGVG